MTPVKIFSYKGVLKLVTQLESEPESNQIGELPEDIPFAIPEKWKWRAFSEAVKSIATKPYQIKSSEVLSEGFIPVVSQSQRSIDGYCNDEDKVIPTELLPIVIFGDHTKVAKYVAFPFIVGADGTKLLRPIHNDLTCEFLYFFVQFMSQKIRNRGYSRHFQFLKSTFIPIPPLKEQVRITARLKKLKPLIEKYGQEQIAIEKLENSFPSLLRLSLLKEAIQGKLVPQLENEPAVEQMGEVPENVPFAIPEKWKWVAIGSVCVYIQRGKSPKYSEIQQIPVVAQKCNQWDGFHIEKAKFIDPETASSYKIERWLQDKDVLWNSTGLGTLGRVALYKKQLNPYGCAVADSHVTVMRCSASILPEYLYYYLCSPSVQSVVEEISDGSTKQKELATKTIREFQFPMPPIEEQHRIVAKLNELLGSVSQLERTISTM